MRRELYSWRPFGRLLNRCQQRSRNSRVTDFYVWSLHGLALLAVGAIVLAAGATIYYGLRLWSVGVPAANAAVLVASPTPPATVRPSATPTLLPWPTQSPTVAPTWTVFSTPAPVEVLLVDVPVGRQQRSLSCELQSASDLAWYHGKPYTWMEIFWRVGHDPGGNPHKGFVGASLDDPPGGIYPAGYGVYAEPIAAALRQIGLKAQVHYQEPTDWLREQIARSRPVMVWATAGMNRASVETWTASDGTVIRGVRGEHTYLVVGYTSAGVWVLNPWNAQRQFYVWPTFVAAWELFDRMAVVVTP